MRRTRTDEDEAESNVMKAGDRWELQEEATVEQRSGRLLLSLIHNLFEFLLKPGGDVRQNPASQNILGLLHLNTTYIQKCTRCMELLSLTVPYEHSSRQSFCVNVAPGKTFVSLWGLLIYFANRHRGHSRQKYHLPVTKYLYYRLSWCYI